MQVYATVGQRSGTRLSSVLNLLHEELLRLLQLLHALAKQIQGASAGPADFRATDTDGIQVAVEDLNGVTYRDPDTEIRSKYGVYQT